MTDHPYGTHAALLLVLYAMNKHVRVHLIVRRGYWCQLLTHKAIGTPHNWMKVDKWAARAEKNRANLINLWRKIKNRLNELCMEVKNSIQINTEMMDEFSNLQHMARHALSRNQCEEWYESPPSLQALTTWAVYADRGGKWRNHKLQALKKHLGLTLLKPGM